MQVVDVGAGEMSPEFPIQIKFADGDEWVLESQDEIAGTLEWFDSDDPDEGATVRDARGRHVHIKVVDLKVILCEVTPEPA